MTGFEELNEGYNEFVHHTEKWTEISNLFASIGETKDAKLVNEASEILTQLSVEEHQTMEKLKIACA